MDVSQFLDKLLMIANIEIVISLLPEVFALSDQASRHSLLQRFDRLGKIPPLWLVEQQMNMVEHHQVVRKQTSKMFVSHRLGAPIAAQSVLCLGD